MFFFLLHCMILRGIADSPTNSNKTTNVRSSTNSTKQLPDIEKNEHKATTNITKSTEEIEWKLSYEIKSDINGVITHYQVIFKSFDCVDTKCQCKNIDLNISIDTIQRTLNDLNCDKIFDHFQFSILPGIVYKFEILPTADFNDVGKSISKSHVFSITQDLDPNIFSFALMLELDDQAYNALNIHTNKLSKTLTNEIAEITEINAKHITVDIDTTTSGKAKIKLMVAKINHSTEAQLATEKIRNLHFKPDTSLISKIIQKSDSMQVAAISNVHDSDVADPSYYFGYNYGAVFLGIIVMTTFFWLISRYFPFKCSEIVNFCKLVVVALVRCIKPRMQQLLHCISDCLLSIDVQRRFSTQYDILNISEEVEMDDLEEESGIVLLNQILCEQNTTLFNRERYIGILKDHWITKVEQLKQLNKEDWTRLNIPQNIQDAITKKLKSEHIDSQFIIAEGSDDVTSSNLDNELSYPVSQSDNDATQKATTDEISDSFSDF